MLSFINDNPDDESVYVQLTWFSTAYYGAFPHNVELASDTDIFANLSTFCYNIEDANDNDNYGTAGYLVL